METHQLEGKLKSLRLSGMLATLEARLAQARGGELGHLEFLEVLLEDEISRREAKALAERIGGRGFTDPRQRGARAAAHGRRQHGPRPH